jgi:soluble lytic murein transglycosylase-like protein
MPIRQKGVAMDLLRYKWLIPCVLVYVMIMSVLFCSAQEIDLDIIARIESNNNPNAYNSTSGAVGMYQITRICLEDYTNYHKTKYLLNEMFDPIKAKIVANWYMNKRIPQMLKHYKRKDTIENRLWCYNAGIGMLLKGIKPKETKEYINKYKALQLLKAR